MLRLTVKWNKQQFDGVEVSASDTILALKSKLQALSQVPVEAQKLVFKGRILKNESTVQSCGLTAEAPLVMVGAAAAAPAKPVEEAKQSIAPGLVNIGNAAYLNAAVQLLRRVPELAEAMEVYAGSDLPKLLREVIESLDRSTGAAVSPLQLIAKVHMTFPQFATRDPSGRLESQDLAVFLKSFVPAVASRLPTVTGDGAESTAYQALFEVETETKVQGPDGALQSRKDTSGLLTAVLDTADSIEAGLRASFSDSKKITRLPAYLLVAVQESSSFPRKKAQWTATLDLSPLCAVAEERKAADTGDRGLDAAPDSTKFSLVGFATVDGDRVANADYCVWLPEADGFLKLKDAVISRQSSCEERGYLFLYAKSS